MILMKKTFQLHLRIEHSVIESLRIQAREEGISLAELCRIRLRDNSQLAKIERLVQGLASHIKLKGGGE